VSTSNLPFRAHVKSSDPEPDQSASLTLDAIVTNPNPGLTAREGEGAEMESMEEMMKGMKLSEAERKVV
jgi:hypothetical protein